MLVKLTFVGRPSIETSDDLITLGSDPKNSVVFPPWVNVQSKHAVIRSVSDRWFIETRDGASIVVNGAAPTRVAWLSAGDQIRLSPQSAVFTFEPEAKPSKVQIVDSESVYFQAIESPTIEAGSAFFPAIPVRPARAPFLDVPPLHDEPLVPITADDNIEEIVFRTAAMPVMPALKADVRSAALPGRTEIDREISSTGSIPVYQPPLSDTLSVSAPEITTDHDLATVARKLSRPAVIPTLRRISPRKAAEISFHDDQEVEESGPHQLSPEQEELRWVLMIVARSAAGGLVIIAILMVLRWIANAFVVKPF